MTERLVLWDLDHTLVEFGDLHYRLYREAFERLHGHQPHRVPNMSGRPDRDSIASILNQNGVEPDETNTKAFATALVDAFAACQPLLGRLGHPTPGAAAALAALRQAQGVVQSVLTGNLEPIAISKLIALNLAHYLDLRVAAFGGDDPDRAQLVEVARRRAHQALAASYDGARTILVGDTPRDIQAAHTAGARIIAVATGLSTAAELQAAGADAVLPDLLDIQSLISLITSDV